ncbi:hypothetical protein [Pandoraea commovens]|uniref:Uncharacterized protein n=1 Tax=Pandoraea commovens TaxID=2508289 RepID=A0A5E4VI08_9BURK|nr:hypothetical protein [Pandoraea commovens]VVE10665.1 hypothetical protein PCO31010_02631 [Pandoraea commovens]
MAIDPSIPLQANTQSFNPLTAYVQAAQINDARQRNALTGLAIQDKQREMAQAQGVSDAYRANTNPDGTVNRTGLIGALASGGQGAVIPGIQKQLLDADTAQLNQQKAQIEVGLQRFGALAQVLSGVNDQNSYTAAIQHAAQTFGPQAVANLPAQYDPAFVKGKLNEALTIKDQLDQKNKQLDYDLRVRTADETQRHNAATEGQAQLHYDATNGVIVNTQTGQARPATGPDGQPIQQPGGKLNESQANATAFGARALDAQNTLRQLEGAGVTNGGRIKQTAESVPVIGGALGNIVNSVPEWAGAPSDQQQSYEQAQRNFISAVLRKESGAAIAESEYANEAKKYFPQPGDSAATIAQKARARDLAVEALKTQAGPGAGLIPGIISNTNKDAAGAPQKQSAPQAQQPAIGQDAALSELRRRAAGNPALAERLKAMGY